MRSGTQQRDDDAKLIAARARRHLENNALKSFVAEGRLKGLLSVIAAR